MTAKIVASKNTKQFLDQEFLNEVSNSILIDDSEKNYWIENFKTLPVNLTTYFYNFIKEKNTLVNLYLDKALEENPEALNVVKEKVSKLRTLANDLMQQETQTDADTTLEAELEKLSA